MAQAGGSYLGVTRVPPRLALSCPGECHEGHYRAMVEARRGGGGTDRGAQLVPARWLPPDPLDPPSPATDTRKRDPLDGTLSYFQTLWTCQWTLDSAYFLALN